MNECGCTVLYRSAVDAPLSQHSAVPPPECAIDKEFVLHFPCEEDSDDDYTEADPILDDLYFRRLRLTLHQTSINPEHNRFLPRYWTPEEDVRVKRIYLGSQRRPWYRKMLRLRSDVYFFFYPYSSEVSLMQAN